MSWHNYLSSSWLHRARKSAQLFAHGSREFGKLLCIGGQRLYHFVEAELPDLCVSKI